MSIRPRNVRKQHERFLLEAFLTAQNLQAEVEEREAPDFFLKFIDRTVGVEITELFIPGRTQTQTLSARESAISRVVAEAKTLFEEKSQLQLRVAIGFVSRFDPTQLRRHDTAVAISNILLRHHFVSDQVVEWRSYIGGILLPTEIEFIHAYPMPDSIRSHWYAPQAGWVVPLDAGYVQERVNAKALRLPRYRATTGEAWLVLVTEGRQPSQFFQENLGFSPEDIVSPFDRTVYFSMMNGSVHELGKRR